MRKGIVFFCFFLFSKALWGMIHNPGVMNLTGSEFKAGNKNWSVAQDSKGVIYFGNNDGLLEFDGNRWRLHRQAPCTTIRSVALDKDDRIFTGGFEEFGFWEKTIKGR